jgi:hypothetical protein
MPINALFGAQVKGEGAARTDLLWRVTRGTPRLFSSSSQESSVPYRPVRITTGDKTETLWSRVSDEATIAWLAERHYLKERGYPDRPPDVDTPTVRLWLARPSEEALPYFRRQALEGGSSASFPVYTVTWHAPEGSGAKFLLTGLLDGSFVGRLILEDEAGNRTIDKGHLYPPGDDPDDVWDAVTRIVVFIDAAGLWEAEALVTDYLDFVALDAELDAARADAIAAGLMTERKLDA